MVTNNFNWKIGGEAGYGILSAGAMFSRAMLRLGLYVFDYSEYPSLIRGGHNTYEVSISDQKVYSQRRPINLLIALNQETIDLHRGELSNDAVVIYNSNLAKVDESTWPSSAVLLGMPLEDMAVQAGSEKVARNVVALGASFALLNAPFEYLRDVIELNFKLKNKEENIIKSNITAAHLGYDYVTKNFKKDFLYDIKPQKNPGRMIMAGNTAIVLGAIQAGCKFLSAYPMTPASSILHVMAAKSKEYNLVVKHVEDEISAINAAIGASYTGVRAMTATSGGGFALMTEAWGMAAMVEVPLVAVEAMRTGPSSGMPTWGGQEDLKFVLSASHGEFPRFVIAPGDVEQCYELIQHAFNLADKYQTPVMFITNKYLASTHKWVEEQDLKKVPVDRGQIVNEQDLVSIKFKRYEDTPSGVSPRSLPGMKGGEHIANSDEHNELGFSEEGAEERTRMMDKRFRKEEAARKEIPDPVVEGDKNADITLISWGSTRGPILEAMKELKKQGKKVNFLQIIYISPFPVQKVKEVFKKAKKIAVVENNKTGQLAGWMREQTGLSPDYKILKYDGRPFFVSELIETIKGLK
ncbi:2-oxoacid:acceptor oxidoreductase subunit alpha [Patescibacteria group bacterium]|nr:2-oxoacid:acceptor oxidoreductase subunit alpha [Patescibacteria group bacterium]MBU0964146.1 2-oxoacid:acceptor oxidoreductase subunit alpha [Patescibacteria group bacterium]